MTNKLILLHGLEGSSQGFKARHLRERFPHIITPDFHGTLQERMQQLAPHPRRHTRLEHHRLQLWRLDGRTLHLPASRPGQPPHPARPPLHRPDFAEHPPAPVTTPTTIYHAQQDTVVPLAPVRTVAEQVFQNLTFHVVDDNHRLQATMQTIDWHNLLA